MGHLHNLHTQSFINYTRHFFLINQIRRIAHQVYSFRSIDSSNENCINWLHTPIISFYKYLWQLIYKQVSGKIYYLKKEQLQLRLPYSVGQIIHF